MNEIWAGSIFTDDPLVVYKDVQLWSSAHVAQCLVAGNAKLRVLSPVHVSSVPLCLAVGPSLQVSTKSDNTIKWLSETLLNGVSKTSQGDDLCGPIWQTLGRQSDQGILVRVGDKGAADKNCRPATEILIYAAVKPEFQSQANPASYNGPSSKGADDEPHGSNGIKVYALPLSSEVFKEVTRSIDTITPPLEESDRPRTAYFLPYQTDPPDQLRRIQQKRQSLSSLFDEASQKRRKLKSRGGESVAQAMAAIDRRVPHDGTFIDTKAESQEQPSESAISGQSRKSLSRVSTFNSIPDSDRTRPASRSGALANGKRSSLHRVESALSPRESSTLSDSDDTVSNQNKVALTKIVMAGMRLYGLQQKKKLGGDNVTVKSMTKLDQQDADDDYKLTYHQTFKAASFALRRQFSVSTIPQETMRDVVDRFLSLFCTDPMASSETLIGDAPGFESQGSDPFGGFDLPSYR